MDRFYVVLPSGDRFGPANVPLLNNWIAEGRLVPETVLEEAATGRRILAGQLAGLDFNQNPSPAPLQPAPYATHLPLVIDQFDSRTSRGSGLTMAAFVVTGISVLMCLTPLGYACAGLGVLLALLGALGRQKGSGCALTLALLCLVCVLSAQGLVRLGANG